MELVGKVIRGQGFAGLVFELPTANLDFVQAVKLDPGVYVGEVVYDNKSYQALICVGPRGSEKFEVHLFGFTGELYGAMLQVKVDKLISPYIPWESEEQMKAKVAADVKLAKRHFGLV